MGYAFTVCKDPGEGSDGAGFRNSELQTSWFATHVRKTEMIRLLCN